MESNAIRKASYEEALEINPVPDAPPEPQNTETPTPEDSPSADAAATDEAPAPKTKKSPPWVPILSILLVVALAATGWLAYERKTLADKVEELETTYSPAYLNVNSLTVTRFEEMVASGEDFLVAVSRPNCPYCRAIDPDFVEIVKRRGLQDKIYYVNVRDVRDDEFGETRPEWVPFKEKYGFWYTPAYMHYKDGKAVDYIDDEVDAAKLEAWLDRNL